MPQNIDKLPKWAQDHIRLLEARRAEAEATLAAITEGRTQIKWTLANGSDHFIPERARITFETLDGKLHMYLIDGKVKVFSDLSLVVKPHASNSISLFEEDRRHGTNR